MSSLLTHPPATQAPETQPAKTSVDLDALYAASNIGEILDQLDRELVGLVPVKSRIREIAALLLIDQARRQLGLSTEAPSLHMSFTGNPGTGKTTVARRMAGILHRLGYIRRDHVVSVTRDDLVGQYIGHTAPKTKEALKKAMGGVLFIDEAYYLYRPENERDYGQEAIEILLQVMEDHRADLVVILAGYKDRLETFFSSNPGMGSRIAHHVDFPDFRSDELLNIADTMVSGLHYRLSDWGASGDAGIHRPADGPAALRQCPVDPQRPRPCPAASGQPAVRPGRRAERRHAPDHRGSRYPRQPRLCPVENARQAKKPLHRKANNKE